MVYAYKRITQEEAVQDLDIITEDTRKRLHMLRDAAKENGTPNTEFYDKILALMAPYGTRASATWLRQQCDPDNPSPPTLRKIFALKQALEEYVETHDVQNTRKQQKPEEQDHEPSSTGYDPVEEATVTESLDALGRYILEEPTKAVLYIANMLNRAVSAHARKGGNITTLTQYLTTRIDFTHGIKASNMPIHTLRGVRTLEQAKALNPSFKTVAALAHALATTHNTNFPWGDDQNLATTIKDMNQQIKHRGPRAKSKMSLAERNKELIQKIQGTDVKGRKLKRGT